MSDFLPPKDKDYVAIFGWPVTYTLSPAFQNEAIRLTGKAAEYVVAPVQTQAEFERLLQSLLADPHFIGANVTNPHKAAAHGMFQDRTLAAELLGAANTVFRKEGGWAVDNTDHEGFKDLLAAAGISGGEKAVVLGAGGTARPVAWVCGTLFKRTVVLARRPSQAQVCCEHVLQEGGRWGPLEKAGAESVDADLVVNTISDDAAAALAGSSLASPRPGGLAIDVRYNPPKTAFMAAAAQKGWRTLNGLDMLLGQGRRSFQRWFGIEAPAIEVLRQALPPEFR